MPILFMAVIALAVFLVMGLMLFYAAYAESETIRKDRLEHQPELPDKAQAARL